MTLADVKLADELGRFVQETIIKHDLETGGKELARLILLHVNDTTPLGEYARRFRKDRTATSEYVRPLKELLDRGLAEQYKRAHENRRTITVVENMVCPIFFGKACLDVCDQKNLVFHSWEGFAQILRELWKIPNLNVDVATVVTFGTTHEYLPNDFEEMEQERREFVKERRAEYEQIRITMPLKEFIERLKRLNEEEEQ